MRRPVHTTALSFLVVSTLSAAAALAQPALTLPQASPKASISQTVGLTEIAITYHRPAVNKRTVWGDLVPYDQGVARGGRTRTRRSRSRRRSR